MKAILASFLLLLYIGSASAQTAPELLTAKIKLSGVERHWTWGSGKDALTAEFGEPFGYAKTGPHTTLLFYGNQLVLAVDDNIGLYQIEVFESSNIWFGLSFANVKRADYPPTTIELEISNEINLGATRVEFDNTLRGTEVIDSTTRNPKFTCTNATIEARFVCCAPKSKEHAIYSFKLIPPTQ